MVAAKLLYLKSRSLLPNLPDEDSGLSLADQLKNISRFAEAAVRLADRLAEHHESYQLRATEDIVSFLLGIVSCG